MSEPRIGPMGVPYDEDPLTIIANHLKVIAENTAPRDKDIFLVSKERDKFKKLYSSLATYTLTMSVVFKEAMEEPDLRIRSNKLREAIERMRSMADHALTLVDNE